MSESRHFAEKDAGLEALARFHKKACQCGNGHCPDRDAFLPWLAQVKADVWDEAYQAGGEFDGTIGYAPANPYRVTPPAESSAVDGATHG